MHTCTHYIFYNIENVRFSTNEITYAGSFAFLLLFKNKCFVVYHTFLIPCIWWDQEGMVYHELLKPGETIKAVRYKQIFETEQIVEKKAARVCQTSWKTNFTPWQCSSTCSRIRKYIYIYIGHELGSLTLPAIALDDYLFFQAVQNDLSSQHFKSWRFQKMDRWMHRFKKQGFLLACNPCVAWKIGKGRSFWRTIFWIKYNVP